jgi:membrane-associated protein
MDLPSTDLLAPLASLIGDLAGSTGPAAYALLILVLLLGACLVPIPEEAAFAVGGALAAQGALSGGLFFFVGWGTVLCLDGVIHALGVRAGPGLRAGRLGRRLSAARWDRLEAVFARRGTLGVAAARFVMGVRIPMFLLAGALGMSRRRFLTTVAIAGLFSAGLPLSLGYLFGAHLETLLGAMDVTRWVLLGVAVAAVVVWWVRRRPGDVSRG